MSRRARFSLGVAALLAAGLYVGTRLEVVTDITHFLPAGSDLRLAQVSRAVADSELTRTMILSLGADDPAVARQAAADLGERLAENPRIAWVQRGPDPGLETAVRELYYPRRFALISDRPEEELGELLSDEGLARGARELKRQLALPSAPLVRGAAPEDPLLAFKAVVDRLRQAQAGSLDVEDGQLVAAGGQRAILFVGSRAPAFASTEQAVLLAEVDQSFAEVAEQHEEHLDLQVAAAARFAVSSERAIKADIVRISVVSTIGIVLLFLGLLRSFRYLLLVALPLAAGFLFAAAVGLAVFGRLHGLTLAFGATLIGVCIDFAVHLFNHHTAAPHPDGPDGTLRRIWPALLLGALTTVAGLGGLAWTSLPGIREIALFTATGVVAALLATRFLLPPLLPRQPRQVEVQRRASEALGRLVESMVRRRRALWVLPAAAVAFSAIALPGLRWEDDVSALNRVDPELRAEDSAVRDQVSQMDPGRFVLSIGADDEEALRHNDLVHERLSAARGAGEVEGFRSIHSLLPSADLQRRNLEAVRGSEGLHERTVAALESEGFVAAAFEPFRQALAAEPLPPLTYEDLASSSMESLVRPFRLTVGNEVAYLTFLRGVADGEALEARLGSLEGVIYFDQMTFLSNTYGNCRARTLELMAAGLMAVFLMVLVRYRRARLALAAFAPALLAAATTLAVVSALGIGASLMHLLGLLLVLSMGVDYGVFMVESRERPDELRATTLSLVIACVTTVLAFGLLGMSHNPALQALGLTTGVGVLLSLVLAPTSLVLLAPPAESDRPPRPEAPR